MAARKPLTELKCRRAQPKAKPYRLYDDNPRQLHLRVQPSGLKIWNIIRRRSHNDEKLGYYPEMTLAMAREAADKKLGTTKPAAAKTDEAKPLTFAAFLDQHYAPMAKRDHKAGDATVKNLKAQFVPLLGNKLLKNISELDVQRFKTIRMNDDIKPSTINRDLDRIRAALNFAVQLKLIESHPFEKVKKYKLDDADPRYLEPEEEVRLRKALDTSPLRALVLLALNTGLRRGELLEQDWANVHLDLRQWVVTAAISKSKKARPVPLNDEALAVLSEMAEKKRIGPVFPEWTASRIKRAWAPLLTAAEIETFRFHDCRHHFASRLVMLGVGLYDVQTLLGHADSEMTQRYARLAPDHLASTVAKLSAVR